MSDLPLTPEQRANKKLFIAIKERDVPDSMRVADVTQALAEGANINSVDTATGLTPLMLVVSDHRTLRQDDTPQLVSSLLRDCRESLNLNAVDEQKENALHHAVLCHDGRRLEEKQQLIDAGVSTKAFNSYGFTPLHKAVLHNNLPAVKLLLTHPVYPVLPDMMSKDGKQSSLHIAIENFSKSLVNPGMMNNRVENAKAHFHMLAAIYEGMRAYDAREYHVSEPLKRIESELLLMDAILQQDYDTEKTTLNEKDKGKIEAAVNRLTEAANARGKEMSHEIVKSRTRHAAETVPLLGQGWLASRKAAWNAALSEGRIAMPLDEVERPSVAAPVTPEMRRRQALGISLIRIIKDSSRTEAQKISAIEEALSRGADVNAQDENGITALMVAFGKTRGFREDEEPLVVKKLLQTSGIRIDIQDKHGKTAVHHALHPRTSQQSEELMLLMAQHPDIEITDNAGNKPLHIAAMWANAPAVKILAEKTLDIEYFNKQGATPLDLCLDSMGDGKRDEIESRANYVARLKIYTDVAKLLVQKAAERESYAVTVGAEESKHPPFSLRPLKALRGGLEALEQALHENNKRDATYTHDTDTGGDGWLTLPEITSPSSSQPHGIDDGVTEGESISAKIRTIKRHSENRKSEINHPARMLLDTDTKHGSLSFAHQVRVAQRQRNEENPRLG